MMICAGAAGHLSGGFKAYYMEHRAQADEAVFLSYLDYYSSPELVEAYRRGTCFIATGGRISTFQSAPCLGVSDTQPNILVLGDSHAAHFVNALSVEFPEGNFLQANASNCRPLLPAEGDALCMEMMNYVIDEFLPSQGKLEAIILSARWGDDDWRRFGETVAGMKRYANQIIIFGPTVEYPAELPLLLARLKRSSDAPIERLRLGKDDRFALDLMMKSAAESTDAIYVSVIDTLCDEKDCLAVTENGVPVAWDAAHFTPEGELLVVSRMQSLHNYFANVAPSATSSR